MEWIETLLAGGEAPVLTAFLLGLLTAINPCQFATSIAAVGLIGRDVSSKRRVLISALLYTVGRVVSYSVLGAVLICLVRRGAETFNVGETFAEWGEWVLPPLMIVGGVLLLLIDRHERCHTHERRPWGTRLRGTWGSLLLGMLLALAFCPASALFYFGMLIPMSAATAGGYFLPAVYAVATSLPVIIVAALMAYSLTSVKGFYAKMQRLQSWFNIAVAIVFILAGILYLLHALGLIFPHE